MEAGTYGDVRSWGACRSLGCLDVCKELGFRGLGFRVFRIWDFKPIDLRDFQVNVSATAKRSKQMMPLMCTSALVSLLLYGILHMESSECVD